MLPDITPTVEPGERPSAGKWNQLAGVAARNESLFMTHIDATGMTGPTIPPEPNPFELTELMLAEDHPGKGIEFKCYKGIWCPQDHTWRYECTDGCDEWVWAIDWRYDVPYPDIGARGLFTPRSSVTYGIIYECVSLDCSSPGSCAAQNIDQPCPAQPSTNYDGEC